MKTIKKTKNTKRLRLKKALTDRQMNFRRDDIKYLISKYKNKKYKKFKVDILKEIKIKFKNLKRIKLRYENCISYVFIAKLLNNYNSDTFYKKYNKCKIKYKIYRNFFKNL
jgi:hypothetical protein